MQLKKIFVIVAVIILSIVNSANADLVENWESGTIDSAKWLVYGSPSPNLNSPGHNSNYALNNHGDNWYNSGITSKELIDASGGISAEFWLKGNSAGSYGQVMYAGLASDVIVPTGQDNGYSLTAYIQVHSDSGYRTISYLASAWNEYGMYMDYDDNQWSKYKIIVDGAGYASFYRNDELRFKTTGAIDMSNFKARFQALGKATFGPMLVDDIQIQSAPEPMNNPPVADAGPDIIIQSENQNYTIIHGVASDLNGDTLIYRWLEGTNALQDWSNVAPNGEAPLSLSVLPTFSEGSHSLVLEVSDGKSISSDETILIVGNSAPTEYLYVSDSVAKVVHKLTLNGTYIKSIGSGVLSSPFNCLFDSKGNLIVADTMNLKVFGDDTHIATFGDGYFDGVIFHARFLTMDNSGNIYVSTYAGGKIEVFNSSYQHVTTLDFRNILGGNSRGAYEGPSGIAFDSLSGHILFSTFWAPSGDRKNYEITTSGTIIREFGNTWYSQYEVKVAPDGKTYIKDLTSGINGIRIFDTNRNQIKIWLQNQLFNNGGMGIGFDQSGNIYVDIGEKTISVYSSSETQTPLRTITHAAFGQCAGLAIGGTVLLEKIVFSSDRSGNNDIWMMNPDGSDLIQLTADPSSDMMPAISPDGTKIAFVSDRSGKNQIWVMKTDGSDQRQITDVVNGAIFPTWNHDGSKIYYSDSFIENRYLWFAHADGSNVTPLNVYITGGAYFKPDGTKFAFEGSANSNPNNYNLFVANTDGTGAVNLSSIVGLTGYETPYNVTAWSQDGRILITGQEPNWHSTTDYRIYWVRDDGSESAVVLNEANQSNFNAGWSPDGSQIVFVTGRSGYWKIWKINGDGTNAQPLTTGNVNEDYPHWGKILANVPPAIPIVTNYVVNPCTPSSGYTCSQITISGSNFGSTQGSGYVDFNGVHAGASDIISWSNTQIVVRIPAGATSGCMRVVTTGGSTSCMNFSIGEMASRRIPDTGQTKCYNSSSEIVCPAPGQPSYGSDGNYAINTPSYVKLDVTGATLPDSAATWAMVRDNITGLIWETKNNKDGRVDYGNPHDADNTYTWYSSDAGTNGGNAGTPGNGTDTEDFIKSLNDSQYGGFSDWRLPSKEDLNSIMMFNREPSNDPTFFPDTPVLCQSEADGHYWTGTTPAFDNNKAFAYSCAGSSFYVPKSSTFLRVRAVRGGMVTALPGRLVSNGDGTVTDKFTGLMWQQGSSEVMSWASALSYAEGSTQGGYDDWRMPSVKELSSIVDPSRGQAPLINTDFFTNTVSNYYWSSTTSVNYSFVAWCVNFADGSSTGPWVKNSLMYTVRMVRGGQNRILGNLVITAPNQADRWLVGEQKAITWDTAGIPGSVKISLSRQGGKVGTFETIIAITNNNGIYNWTVTGPISVNCVLRVEPLINPSKATSQGLFSIASANTIVINPEPNSITAPWTLTGPGNYSQTGTGDQTLTNLTPGDYTLTWGVVPGWSEPTPMSSVQSLIYGGSITFEGSYAQVPLNRPPVFDPIVDITVKEGDLLQFAISATDPDAGDTLTYSAGDLPDGAAFDPVSRTFSWTPHHNQAGTYANINFTVTDNGTPQLSTSETITIRVDNFNRLPTANAGPDQVVYEGSLVTLDATGSSDPDSDILTISWTRLAGPPVSLDDKTDPYRPKFVAPLVSAGGATVTFQLTVSDGNANSTDTVNVTIKNVNHRPIADAGNPQTVREGTPVTLNGEHSYDEDGETLTYSWTQTGGSVVPLNNANTANLTFTAPEVGRDGAILTFALIVNDGVEDSEPRETTITVKNENQPAIANAGEDQTVNEGGFVQLDGSNSTDPDQDPITYSWSQISGQTVPLIGSATSKPSFTAPLVAPGGEKLVFQLMAADDLGAGITDVVEINVRNINDPPNCILAKPSIATIWPPDHKMVNVGIIGITDPNAGDQFTITVTGVTQDEPVDGLGDGDTSPDAVIQGGNQTLVRVERAGGGNGRVYKINFTAMDRMGEGCSGAVTLCVPHDRIGICTDDGQDYYSTQR